MNAKLQKTPITWGASSSQNQEISPVTALLHAAVDAQHTTCESVSDILAQFRDPLDWDDITPGGQPTAGSPPTAPKSRRAIISATTLRL